MYKFWTILVVAMMGCSEPSLVLDANDAAALADAEPASEDAEPSDAGEDAANEGPADGGAPLAMDAGVGEDAAMADAAISADGGMDVDAGPDPDGGGAEPDAGSDAGPVCGATIRPRPPAVYAGAPAGCPAPSGPMLSGSAASTPLYGISIEDRWGTCSPGEVFIHTVPDSIQTWCRAELEAATDCADLAYRVADCRACASAWVGWFEDTSGCPLGAPSPGTVDWASACGSLAGVACASGCGVACPYAASPRLDVATWCQTWMDGARSCADLDLAARECQTCYALAREIIRP